MRKISKVVFLILALTLCVGLFSACSSSQETKAPTKVGFIFVGPVSDKGWSYAHNEARKAMMETIGLSEDDCPYIESVPENQDCEVAIETLVKRGCKIIFTTSFGFMDYTLSVAEKYPDVKFMHCSGYKTAENMGNYFGRIYQARYLSGMAAGAATKSNKIGYVAAFPIPEVVRGINAFTLGVRAVNPDAEVKVIWTNTWYDPAMEKEAAESLLAAGVDVMAQHQDTNEPVSAAEKVGAYSVGYHTSMSEFAPNGYLTSAMWDFTKFYTDQVQAQIDGTWKSVSYWEGLNDGIVKLDEFGPSVTDETKSLINAAKDKIVAGSWDVFTGPIKDQSGAVKIADGQKMTDEELLSFDWFVEGVDGVIQ